MHCRVEGKKLDARNGEEGGLAARDSDSSPRTQPSPYLLAAGRPMWTSTSTSAASATQPWSAGSDRIQTRRSPSPGESRLESLGEGGLEWLGAWPDALGRSRHRAGRHARRNATVSGPGGHNARRFVKLPRGPPFRG